MLCRPFGLTKHFFFFFCSPYRIGDDIGSAYAMGLVGGSIFHSFNGFRNAATGQKIRGMLREVSLGYFSSGMNENVVESCLHFSACKQV